MRMRSSRTSWLSARRRTGQFKIPPPNQALQPTRGPGYSEEIVVDQGGKHSMERLRKAIPVEHTRDDQGRVRPLSAMGTLAYWLSFSFLAALVSTGVQLVTEVSFGAALVLGFAIAHPIMSWRNHRRLKAPLGKPFVLDTALWWTCCLVGLLVLTGVNW